MTPMSTSTPTPDRGELRIAQTARTTHKVTTDVSPVRVPSGREEL